MQTSQEEDKWLRYLLLQNVWGHDRRKVAETARTVHRRELEARTKEEAVQTLLSLSQHGGNAKKKRKLTTQCH